MNSIRRPHYAWVICAVGTLLMVCNMGLCSSVLAVYLPLIEATGISGSDGSAIISIRCLFSFISTFFVTAYYKKLGFRPALILASVLAIVSALIFAVGGSPVIYFIGAAVSGTVYGLGAAIPASIMISKWFNRKRGLAMGIVMSGSGIGMVVFSPIIQKLTAVSGIRTAFLVQAGFEAICLVLTILLVAESPDKIGKEAYGCSEEKTEVNVIREENKSGISGSMWIILAVMMVLIGGSGQMASSHISVLMTGSGYTAAAAAAATSLFGLTLMIGKFLFGGISDRIGVKNTTGIFMLIFMGGCALTLLLPRGSMALCYTAALILGLSCAYFTVGTPLWAHDLDHKEKYAGTLRTFQLFYSLGGIIFTAVPGRIADRTGEYMSSYLLAAAATLVSMGILLYAYKRCAEKK